MDQHSPNRSQTETLAAQSAAAVHALRTRAQRLLDEQQSRLAEIEQRIAAQLELVGDELSRDAVGAPIPDSAAELEALDELRSEVERDRDQWQQLRDEQATELDSARERVEQSERELQTETAKFEARAAELDAQAAQIEAQSAELAEQQSQLAARQEEAHELTESLARERDELDAAIAQFTSAQESTAQSDREELDRLHAELEHDRETWTSERQQLETRLREQSAHIDDLSDELKEARRRLNDLQESMKTDVSVARNELAAQAAAWQRERAKLSSERGELVDELQTVRSQLARSLEQEAAASAGLLEVVPKFELAMEDVRRLRGRVAELEQELAKRPERSQAELPELIHLRSERDQLAEQVAALEAQIATQAKPDDENQIADLQRRFEMAVEDVRQLKTEKAKLEQQLAAARQSPAPAGDPISTDWEAQKRRLLASLEGDDPTTPERRQERTSIEGTIRITDEVVAQKDREIETLRQQLDTASAASMPEQILDSDELIRAERERLAALEAELHERLRAAEMELSTARAKLTRQESELERQRGELEALRKTGAWPVGITAAPQKRRWLDKLGLGGDEEK